jgi:hypothetical protein
LVWCDENGGKFESNVSFFGLQIRNRNIDDALKFAQENLADQGGENSAVLEELER